MSITKNAIIRYMALDRCFSNPGKKCFIEDLINACNEALLEVNPNSTGVQRRQVYDDIKFMEDPLGYNAPIETYKDGRKVYRRYSDMNFTISNQPLNELEEQQLKESLMALTRFKGMPQFEWVEDMMNRLKLGAENSSQEIISFQENPELKGLNHFDSLYNAIVNQQVLSIKYTPFGREQRVFEIHPYYLKQYNNRWFFFGKNHKEDKISNLPLDRIDAITESKTKFIPNTEIDFEDFFFNTLGVSVPTNDEPKEVLIKVDERLWPWIETKPLHHTQKVKNRTDDYIVIQIKVHLNYELEGLLLYRGEELEVLEPLCLREKMKTRIQNLYKKYH